MSLLPRSHHRDLLRRDRLHGRSDSRRGVDRNGRVARRCFARQRCPAQATSSSPTTAAGHGVGSSLSARRRPGLVAEIACADARDARRGASAPPRGSSHRDPSSRAHALPEQALAFLRIAAPRRSWQRRSRKPATSCYDESVNADARTIQLRPPRRGRVDRTRSYARFRDVARAHDAGRPRIKSRLAFWTPAGLKRWASLTATELRCRQAHRTADSPVSLTRRERICIDRSSPAVAATSTSPSSSTAGRSCATIRTMLISAASASRCFCSATIARPLSATSPVASASGLLAARRFIRLGRRIRAADLRTRNSALAPRGPVFEDGSSVSRRLRLRFRRARSAMTL